MREYSKLAIISWWYDSEQLLSLVSLHNKTVEIITLVITANLTIIESMNQQIYLYIYIYIYVCVCVCVCVCVYLRRYTYIETVIDV